MRSIGIIFIVLSWIGLMSLSACAETVTLGWTESVVNTSGGNPALAYCTIYKARGATGTNWQRVKHVARSDPDGGGVRSEPVDVPLAYDALPVSYRFAFTCTTVEGKESPRLIPNSTAGNPYTVEP